MAAFALQPHVAECLDVVMNEGALEFRMEQVEIPVASRVAGLSLREAALDASGTPAARPPAWQYRSLLAQPERRYPTRGAYDPDRRRDPAQLDALRLHCGAA